MFQGSDEDIIESAIMAGDLFTDCIQCREDTVMRGMRVFVCQYGRDAVSDQLVCNDCIIKKGYLECRTCRKYFTLGQMSKCHPAHCDICDPNDGGDDECLYVCAICDNRNKNEHNEFYRCKFDSRDEACTLCQHCMERKDFKECLKCDIFNEYIRQACGKCPDCCKNPNHED